jgi:hypothetical protein
VEEGHGELDMGDMDGHSKNGEHSGHGGRGLDRGHGEHEGHGRNNNT